jgi:hypothetical protein
MTNGELHPCKTQVELRAQKGQRIGGAWREFTEQLLDELGDQELF